MSGLRSPVPHSPRPESPETASDARPESFLRTAALVFAIAALWLSTRPYSGVVFDARFYMVEALHAVDPGRFAQDLYFKFGSQGNFSLFSRLYPPLLRAFGVGPTAMILSIAGQSLWLFGLVRLTRNLVGPQWMWLSLAVTVGMLHAYPGGFGYGENQLTARIFAEAAVLLGLSFLDSRPFWTVLLLGLAVSLHPLMALPGIAVAFVYLALGRPVWWAVMGIGALLAAGLGLAGIAPFSNLFRTIDPEWFAVINIRSLYCLLGNWPRDFFVQMAAAFAWGAAAWWVVGPPCRRLLSAILLVAAAGLVCAYLGGDLAHNLLVVQLQPWRAIWLLQLVSHFFIPIVIAAVLARTSFDSARWTVLLSMGFVLLSSLGRLGHHDSAENFSFTRTSLMVIAGACAVIAAMLLPRLRGSPRIAALSACLACALFGIAVSRWDARTPWLRYVESPEPPPPELTALLPAKASVYWEDGLEMLWLRMKRPSYFSCDQATGVLFYRETAMAYRHRAASVWPLRTDDFTKLDNCAVLDPRPKPRRDRAGLEELCRREPELDYVVLKAPLDGAPYKIWTAPVRFQDFQASSAAPERFYIHACAQLRQTRE